LLDKLSSYNIFNYLLPGVLFAVLAEALTAFHFVQKDIVVGVFVYYFIGLVVSRLGSILIEPVMKWTRFVQFAPYADFVSASKNDSQLLILSEANNMYRTFCALFVSLGLLKGYEALSARYAELQSWGAEALGVVLLVLFCFSYRKQTKYITKRVQASKEQA